MPTTNNISAAPVIHAIASAYHYLELHHQELLVLCTTVEQVDEVAIKREDLKSAFEQSKLLGLAPKAQVEQIRDGILKETENVKNALQNLKNIVQVITAIGKVLDIAGKLVAI